MDIQFHGGNCITISNKQVRISIDDNLQDLGAKSITKEGDISIYTGPHGASVVNPKIVIDHPGEFEVSEVSVYGIALRGHMDEANKKDVTAFKIIVDDLRFLVTGHIYPELTERELEEIGMVDVLFVPVGGNGYTTDPVGALKLIKKIEPKVVIPTHYHDDALSLPVPQQTLEQALTSLSMEPKDTTDKYKIKSADLGEDTQLVVVTKS